MQIDYDLQADAVYIRLCSGDVHDTLPAGKYVFVDVDESGVPLGTEILYASWVLAGQEITSFTVNIAQLADLPHAPLPASPQ